MPNLLKWVQRTPCPSLKADCNEIVFAVRHFGPSDYRTTPYNDISLVALMDRDMVIPALKESFRAYRTARVLAIIRILESE
jgi:hypothetical protein